MPIGPIRNFMQENTNYHIFTHYGKDCLQIYAAYKKKYVILNENIYHLNNVLTGTKAIKYYTSADSWFPEVNNFATSSKLLITM